MSKFELILLAISSVGFLIVAITIIVLVRKSRRNKNKTANPEPVQAEKSQTLEELLSKSDSGRQVLERSKEVAAELAIVREALKLDDHNEKLLASEKRLLALRIQYADLSNEYVEKIHAAAMKEKAAEDLRKLTLRIRKSNNSEEGKIREEAEKQKDAQADAETTLIQMSEKKIKAQLQLEKSRTELAKQAAATDRLARMAETSQAIHDLQKRIDQARFAPKPKRKWLFWTEKISLA